MDAVQHGYNYLETSACNKIKSGQATRSVPKKPDT